MPVTILEFDSRLLRHNPLGDPTQRRIPVYLPPSYPRRRYPVLYLLAGFTGFGEQYVQRSLWSENIVERVDRLIGERRMREAIIVMPDCLTRYGGSQYLNSTATGPYADHIAKELAPWVDKHFATTGRRGVIGKSSGGFGALYLGMKYPDVFHAVASHSGDMYFEYCYLPDFPKALDGLQPYGGIERFLRAWEQMPKRLAGGLHAVVNTLAMASCYSPNRRAKVGFDVPFDLNTGELRDDVWQRWKTFDPIDMLQPHRKALRGMRLVYLDCGNRDQFALHHGARIFAAHAKALGIKVRHEEFDDNHSGVSYRFDRSLPLLVRALSS